MGFLISVQPVGRAAGHGIEYHPEIARGPRLAQPIAAQLVRLGADAVFPWFALDTTPATCAFCDLPERRLADELSADTGTLCLGSRACAQKEGLPGHRWAARAGLGWPVGRARSGGQRTQRQATPFETNSPCQSGFVIIKGVLGLDMAKDVGVC